MKVDLVTQVLEENNLISFLKQEEKVTINTRAKLDLGKGCNRHCSFCYYEKQLDSKDWLIPENARILVKGLLDNGITQIELSGGEPTLNPYYFDIIDIIKEEFSKRNMEHYITIVTNGWFGITDSSVRKHCRDLKEILISLHGHEHTHNNLVKNKMAFTYILNVLRYLRLSKIQVRLNFVVLNDNLNALATNMLIDFIKDGYIQQLNLLPINYWSDAKQNKSKIDNLVQREHLEQFLYTYENSYSLAFINDIGFSPRKQWLGINLRYHSFCEIREQFHKYIRSHYDHVFDLKDWNKIYYPKDINPKLKLLNTPGLKFEDIYNSKEINFKNSIKQASKDRLLSHFKTNDCRKCKHNHLCDGYKG